MLCPSILLTWVLALPQLGVAPVRAQSPWPRFVIDDSLAGADGVHLGDANGDGFVDIVTGWEESGRVRGYLHPGRNRVEQPWPLLEMGPAPAVEDAMWFDRDGEGVLEVLSSCEGAEMCLRVHRSIDSREPDAPVSEGSALQWSSTAVRCSRGVTRWMFAAPLPPAKAESSQGKALSLAQQFVVGSKNPSGQVAILDASADSPDDWSIRKLAAASWVMSLVSADVDGDGDFDVLYTDRKPPQSGVYWLENPGSSEELADASEVNQPWQQHLIGAAGEEVMFVALPNHSGRIVSDFDASRGIYVGSKPNNVHRFYVSKESTGAALRGTWQVETIKVQPVEQMGRMKGLAVGDLDLDGVDEIVVSCESAVPPKSGVVVLKHDAGSSVWAMHDVSGVEGIKFDLIELVDLDLDGDLDILTCEERHAGRGLGVIWYANPHFGKR